MRIGLIGQGAVATLALDALAQNISEPIEALICLARPHSVDKAARWASPYRGRLARDIVIETSVEGFLAARPRVVAEAAGHQALVEAGSLVLAAGVDLIVSAVGALSDDGLRSALEREAQLSGASLIISSGAIGGSIFWRRRNCQGLSRFSTRPASRLWRGSAQRRANWSSSPTSRQRPSFSREPPAMRRGFIPRTPMSPPPSRSPARGLTTPACA